MSGRWIVTAIHPIDEISITEQRLPSLNRQFSRHLTQNHHRESCERALSVYFALRQLLPLPNSDCPRIFAVHQKDVYRLF